MSLLTPSSTSAPDLSLLTPSELLVQLEREGDRASQALMETCVAHGEAMVQALAAKIAEEDAWFDSDDDASWLHLHAALILGRIASESSALLLLELLRKADSAGDVDFQDWLAGDWPVLFENKPPGTTAAVQDLATDTSMHWYARCQGVEVVLDGGLRQGPEALDAAIDWVAGLANNESDDWQFRIIVACTLLDFPRQRHRPMLDSMALEETRRAEDEILYARVLGTSDVESAFRGNLDDPNWKHRDNPWNFYRPEFIAARQERWREEVERAARYRDPQYPIVRTEPKIGRNDPCPCASGKKYKKCCLDRDKQTVQGSQSLF